MHQELLVDVLEDQIIVAVVEDGVLVEVYLERELERRIVGNIYLGMVENVLPGMQAAFINLGLEKNAFLYIEDLINHRSDFQTTEGAVDINIKDILKKGQQILVQVTKEPIKAKGARVTADITIPGRYAVLMPYVDYVGISKKIEDEAERERLKQITLQKKPENMGVIVRTVAKGIDEQDLQGDIENLKNIWDKILDKVEKKAAPKAVYKDLDLGQRIIRDLLNEKVTKIIVNSLELKEQISESINELSFKMRPKVVFQKGDILALYSVLHQLEQAFNKKVWLSSGAHIIIDQTEALTVIDVNTGKYIGKDNLQSTVVNTNLQAVKEVVRQLRLRNIGGIIIIDFIDMTNNQDKKLILDTLQEELKKDKTKTIIMGITNLGLVEMTRKKARKGLESLMLTDCPYCEGKGKLFSVETIALRAKKQIYSLSEKSNQPVILIKANPLVAANLIGSSGASLRKIEENTGKIIVIKGEERYHLEDIDINSVSEKEIEATLPVKEGDIIDLFVEKCHDDMQEDALGRISGYIISVIDGAPFVGQQVTVKIIKTYKTYARAKVI